jgi:hypothetical protein
MRILLYLTSLLVLSASLASAQEMRPWAEKLFSNTTSHDFGNVPHGAQLSFRFPFTNIYQVPLDVTISRVSCGCVTATTSTPNVKTRESGFIEVKLNTRTFTGDRRVRIYVTFSGAQYYSTAELKANTFSRPDVVFNPGDINFGVVAQGQTPSANLEVDYAGVLSWRVTEVVPNGLPVEIRPPEALDRSQTPGRVGYRLTVNLRADAPVGPVKGEILLKTNDPASPLLPVLVEANVQPSLTVAPATLRPSLKVNEATTLTVVVRGIKDFRILSVEGLENGVSLAGPLPDVPEKTHRLGLKIQRTTPGEFHQKIQIKTDFQSNPVTVTVEGNASP